MSLLSRQSRFASRFAHLCARLAVSSLLAAAALPAFATVTPIDYYRMGETENASVGGVVNSTPDSVGGKTLTFTGGPFYTADVGALAGNSAGSTRAIDLFGNNISVFGQAPLLTSATTNIGLEVFARAYDLSGNQFIALNGTRSVNGFGILRSGSQYCAEFEGGVLVGCGPAVVNAWTHLAVVVAGGVSTFYINGVKAAQAPANPLPATGAFRVGASSTGEFFSGMVDEVRLFSFAPGAFQTRDLLLYAPDISVELPTISGYPYGNFGEVHIGTSKHLPFTVRNSGSRELKFTGTPRVAVTGPNAADFIVTPQPPATLGAASTRVHVGNAGFEAPVQTTATYAPTGASWTFGTQAGIARNGAFYFFTDAIEGTQAAFIQTSGPSAAQSFVSQTVAFPNAGAWQIRFRAVRHSPGNANDLVVRMDGVTIGSVSHTTLDESNYNKQWREELFTYNSPDSGTHTLTIAGTRTGGDFTTAIDDVSIEQQSATIANANFETPVLASGAYVVNPTNASWSFQNAGLIQVARTDFPRYVNRLEGSQAAFIFQKGTLSQSMSFPYVGSYVVRFKTAREAYSYYPLLLVSIDGQEIGRVPADSLDDPWVTFAFPYDNAAPGSHTLSFHNDAGDDRVVIDDVEVLYLPSATLDLAFKPLGANQRNATLSISSDDSGKNPITIALTGEGIGQNLVVEQPLGAQIVNGTSRNFGTVQPGLSPLLEFNLSSNGTTYVGSIVASIIGPDASSFVLARKPSSTVFTEGTKLVVMFDPLTTGTKNATLHITSNDPDDSPFDVSLSGTLAAVPEIAVDQPVGQLVPAGGNRNFAATNIGATSTLDFTLRNSGTTTLTLTGARVTINGANASDFSVTTAPPATVPPAIAIGNRGFEAPVLDDGGSVSNYNSGNFLNKPLRAYRWIFGQSGGVAANGSSYYANPAPEGRQAGMLQTPDGYFEYENASFPAGNYLLRASLATSTNFGVNAIRVDVPNFYARIPETDLTNNWKTFAYPFTIASATTGSVFFQGESSFGVSYVDDVEIDGAATFRVQFAPSSGGARTATLHITSDDPDEGSYDIALTGNGVGGEIAVEQPAGTGMVDGSATSNFGNVETGTNTSLTYTVRNVSPSAMLSGIVPSINGADAASFQLTSLPVTSLAPGESTTFSVRFAPVSAGGNVAALHIASSDEDENPFDIALQGNGVASTVEIGLDQPAGLLLPDGGLRSFPATPIGTPVTLDFAVYNTGNAPLSLTGTPRVQVGGANAAEFVVLSQPPTTIANAPVLRNYGFEEPALNAADFVYAPGGAGWTFGAHAGVARNGSPWYVSPAPDGTQAAFIQTFGASATDSFVSQPLIFGSGSYLIRFAAVRRATTGANDLAIKIDGATIGTVPAASLSDDSWRTFAIAYTSPSAATRTLTIAGTRTGGDFATAIDGVQVVTVATVQVQFTPTATGARAATLTIPNDDSDENPYDVALSGSSIGPDIAVEQPLNTSLADGDARNLGGVVVGSATVMTFTIRNTGTAALTGLTTSINGPDFTWFQVITAPVAPLAPGASTTMDVRFAPGQVRTYNATLHVASNDPDENPFDIPLSGSGFQEEIRIEQPAGQFLGDSGSLSLFGFNVPLGQPVTLSYLLRNIGVGKDLTGIALSIDGPDAARFSVSTQPAANVAAGEGTPFAITFTPTVPGQHDATLHIASSDPNWFPTFDILLEGTAVDPEIAVEQPSGTGLVDGVASRSFGNVTVGGNSFLTFTIRNVGPGTLAGILPIITGPDAARFAITTPPNASLSSGSSTQMTVRFTPDAAIAFSASLQIPSNDRDENPFDIALTGNGISPEIDVQQPAGEPVGDGGARTVGPIKAGTTSALTFVVKNVGIGQDLTGVGVTLTGPGASAYSVTTAPSSTVAPGASTSFVVTYAPTSGGTHNASLAISSNDANENPYDIALTGSATDPKIVVEQPAGAALTNGQSRGFGDVDYHGNASLTFSVRNTGTSDLTDVLATLSGADAGSFSVTTAPAVTVAPGASTTLVVTYAPAALGPHAAVLSIASSDDTANPFTVPLTGRGIGAVAALEQPAASVLPNGGARLFAAVTVGSNGSLGFVLKNAGLAADLTGISASLSGPDASYFSISGAPSASLAPGASASFSVVFAPDAARVFDAKLSIANSDVDANPYVVELSGSGLSSLQADLQVANTNGQNVLRTTQDTIYTVQILNAGPSSVPTLRVIDDLPDAFINVGWTCTSQPPNLCPASSGLGDIDQTTVVALPSNAMLQYLIVARPTGSLGTLLTNTASVQIVGFDVGDPNSSNDSASDTDPIIDDSIFLDGFEVQPHLLRPELPD